MTIERPMFPPRAELCRRVILAGVASAAALPMAAAMPAPVEPADPIFAAIEAHRKAYATMQAIFAEHRKAHELTDAEVGPAHIEIPSMVDPGSTIEATHWMDIERAIPREEYPDLHLHHRSLLEEQKAVHYAAVEALLGGDEDELTDEPYRDELDTRDTFSETVPTTIAGLLAMIVYAGEITKRDPEAFADSNCSLIETLAAAAKAVQS